MKELVEFTSYMAQTLDMEKARMFIQNFKNYEVIFSEETLEKALSKFRVTDFATFKPIPIQQSNYYEEKYPRYSKEHLEYFSDYIDKNGITYEARIKKLAYSYIVPNPYQLNEKEFLRECLILSIPEIDKFKWEMYHLDSYEDYKTHKKYYSDIYLKTTEGSLYCPVEALVNYDKEAIMERHISYHKSYYNTSDRKKYLDKSLSVLDTIEVELLFYVLDCYKNKKEVDFVNKLSPEGKKLLDNIKKEKTQKANQYFVTHSLKDMLKNVITPNVSTQYVVKEDEEYVDIIVNEEIIQRTHITGLDHKDIIRHVLFEM